MTERFTSRAPYYSKVITKTADTGNYPWPNGLAALLNVV